MIVRHCSPTLAGIKTGNMFNCAYSTYSELRSDICGLNRRLVPKGLRILPLRLEKNSALIYVYRPSRLKHDLQQSEACSLLKAQGYSCGEADSCILRLIDRLNDGNDFPHEIGLFLGYPPEDVRGFIENNAKNCKCVGCWKVYGDEKKAKLLFERYKKCTENYIRQLKNGNTIDRLTVVV